MQAGDWETLTRAQAWLSQGYRAHLITVVATWGSAPRLPGALLVVREDGQLAGSVSGGCVEEDVSERAQQQRLPQHPSQLSYGINQAEAQRFGIPCGGQLHLFVEPLLSPAQLTPMLTALNTRTLIQRSVHLQTGEVRYCPANPSGLPSIDGDWFHTLIGPQWRLLIIGANPLGSVLAKMAQALEFHVLMCDPRTEMQAQWSVAGVTWHHGMPDDVVLAIKPDPHTAIVAVTHDPKLDDMALMEALTSDAYYVGALGAVNNQEKRKLRLKSLGLRDDEIARLHGPVGLNIGSRTPAEIAIAILAALIQVRAQQRTQQHPLTCPSVAA